jgi:hypothetical protein
MSDTQQGPQWWRASDGKWYPPESHPAYRSPPPAPAFGNPVPTAHYGAPPTGPSVPPIGYPTPGGTVPPTPYPAPAGGAPPWGGPYAPYGAAMGNAYPAAKQTNGLAIASLACSIGGIIPFFFGVPCVVGIILGFVSLGQIKKTDGVQQGRGLALAGVIVGFSLIAIFVLFVVLAVAGVHSNGGTSGFTPNQ